MLPSRHFKSKSSGEIRRQLDIGEEMVTTEAAKILNDAQIKAQKKSEKEKPEDHFDYAIRSHELPVCVRQLKFAKEAFGRNWMFDFAWPEYKVAVEIEGLVMRQLRDHRTSEKVWCVYGRHATITGIKEDMVKYNTAALLGWTLLRFEQSMVKDGQAIAMTMRTLASRGWLQGVSA